MTKMPCFPGSRLILSERSYLASTGWVMQLPRRQRPALRPATVLAVV
jgi:hypothetical protein